MSEENEFTERKTVYYHQKAVLSAVLRRKTFASCPSADAFYASCVRRLMKKAEAFAPRAAAIYARNGGVPLSVQSACRVTYETDACVSVMFDVTVFDGKKSAVRRYGTLWDKKSGRIIGKNALFVGGYASSRAIIRQVWEAVREAVGHAGVSETGKRCGVSLSRCCIVPHGAAFFFPQGTFVNAEGGIPLFVVPKEKIRPYMKYCPWENEPIINR